MHRHAQQARCRPRRPVAGHPGRARHQHSPRAVHARTAARPRVEHQRHVCAVRRHAPAPEHPALVKGRAGVPAGRRRHAGGRHARAQRRPGGVHALAGRLAPRCMRTHAQPWWRWWWSRMARELLRSGKRSTSRLQAAARGGGASPAGGCGAPSSAPATSGRSSRLSTSPSICCASRWLGTLTPACARDTWRPQGFREVSSHSARPAVHGTGARCAAAGARQQQQRLPCAPGGAPR